MYEQDFLQAIYQGSPVFQDDYGQWLDRDTMQPLPGVSQQDITDEVEFGNLFTFADVGRDEDLYGSENEANEASQQPLDITPFLLFGDNNPFSLV